MKIILTPASIFDLEAQSWLASKTSNGNTFTQADLQAQGINLSKVTSRAEVSQRLLALYQLADKLEIPLLQAREILPLTSYLSNCVSQAQEVSSDLYSKPISVTQQAKQAYFSDLFKLLREAQGKAWQESSFAEGKISNSFLAYKAEKFWQLNDSTEIAELLGLNAAEITELELDKTQSTAHNSTIKERVQQKYSAWLTEQELAKDTSSSAKAKSNANSKIPYNWRVRKDEWILFLDEQAIYAPDLEKKLTEIQKLTLNAEVLVISDQILDQTTVTSLAELDLLPQATTDRTNLSDQYKNHDITEQLAFYLFNSKLNQLPLQQQICKLEPAEQELFFGKEMKREFDYKFNLHRQQKGTNSAFFVRLLDSGNGISGFMIRASAINKVVDFLPPDNALVATSKAGSELRLANDLWLLPKSNLLEVAYLRGAWVRGFSEVTPLRNPQAWQQKRDFLSNWGIKLKAYLRMLKLVAGLDD